MSDNPHLHLFAFHHNSIAGELVKRNHNSFNDIYGVFVSFLEDKISLLKMSEI